VRLLLLRAALRLFAEFNVEEAEVFLALDVILAGRGPDGGDSYCVFYGISHGQRPEDEGEEATLSGPTGFDLASDPVPVNSPAEAAGIDFASMRDQVNVRSGEVNFDESGVRIDSVINLVFTLRAVDAVFDPSRPRQSGLGDLLDE